MFSFSSPVKPPFASAMKSMTSTIAATTQSISSGRGLAMKTVASTSTMDLGSVVVPKVSAIEPVIRRPIISVPSVIEKIADPVLEPVAQSVVLATTPVVSTVKSLADSVDQISTNLRPSLTALVGETTSPIAKLVNASPLGVGGASSASSIEDTKFNVSINHVDRPGYTAIHFSSKGMPDEKSTQLIGIKSQTPNPSFGLVSNIYFHDKEHYLILDKQSGKIREASADKNGYVWINANTETLYMAIQPGATLVAAPVPNPLSGIAVGTALTAPGLIGLLAGAAVSTTAVGGVVTAGYAGPALAWGANAGMWAAAGLLLPPAWMAASAAVAPIPGYSYLSPGYASGGVAQAAYLAGIGSIFAAVGASYSMASIGAAGGTIGLSAATVGAIPVVTGLAVTTIVATGSPVPAPPIPFGYTAFDYVTISDRTDGSATKDLTFGRYLSQPTPLVLDLDGNGVSTTTLQEGVVFDLNADGKAHSVAWIAGGDALLVRDMNGDGCITSGAELFGSSTRLKNGEFARDGFSALKDLDSNSDGVFDSLDTLYNQIKLWVDANHDGISSIDELFDLNSKGVISINLNAQTSDRQENGNLYALEAKYSRKEGGIADVIDVFFAASPEEALHQQYLTVAQEYLQLTNNMVI
jgi:hypothetical protein